MKKFKVTSPEGKTLTISGEREPTEQELIEIFNSVGSEKKSFKEKAKDRFLKVPMVERALSGAIGGVPAFFGGATNAEDSLPLLGQAIGGFTGGFGGAVGGTAAGEGARQVVKKAFRGKDISPKEFGANVGLTAATEGIFRGAGKLAKPAANRLMASVLKPSLNEAKANKNIGLEAAKRGLFGTKSGIAKKAQKLIDANETELQKVLKPSKGQVDARKVAAELDEIERRFLNVGDDEAALKAIQQAKANIMAKGGKSGKIPVQEANQLKRDLFKVVKDSQFGADEIPVRAEVRRTTASGLRKGIERAEPSKNVRDINQNIGVASKTKELIEDQALKANNKPIVPFVEGALSGGFALSHPIVPAAIIARRAFGSTPIKSFAASMLVNPKVIKGANISKFGISEAARRFGANVFGE